MKVLNLILKGLYIFLGWYFTADTVREFIGEVTTYFKNRHTAAESEPGLDNEDTEIEQKKHRKNTENH